MFWDVWGMVWGWLGDVFGDVWECPGDVSFFCCFDYLCNSMLVYSGFLPPRPPPKVMTTNGPLSGCGASFD